MSQAKRQKTLHASPSMKTNSAPAVAMDESQGMDMNALNRFSRQNAALGAETTAKLIKMRILIVGMRAVGVETAKNLALQGAGGITLVDNGTPSAGDMGLNFFISQNDINTGASRADITAAKLRDLNPLCSISCSAVLSEEVVRAHSAMVITDVTLPLNELLMWNSFCRSKGIAFFYSFVGGVSASIFSDLGPHHVIHDPTGGKPMQKLITGIAVVDDNQLLIHYESPEGQASIAITEGFFEISDVHGIPSINGRTFVVSHPDKDPVKTVRIQHTLANDEIYKGSGQLFEKKVPKEVAMDSLEFKLKNPGSPFADPPTTVLTDMIHFGAELQQHVALYGTLEFSSRRGGQFPAVYSENDASEVLDICRELLDNKAIAVDDLELDNEFIRKFAMLSSVELQPMAAFVGGVLGQEVVKCSGKFTPIPGFLHFSAREVLPTENPSRWESRGSRYDSIANIFGWDFVESLHSLNYFMVGCGALGCEFLKNFALNGVCCGSGKLVVTDADRIELSNLSRQFLFREHNVGQPKSRAAATMAKQMNPDFNVEAYEMFVGPKTEDTFNDDFWMELHGVCNALDNMVPS